MKLLISEIVDNVKKAKTKNERVEILRQHKDRKVLRDLLIVSYDLSVNVLIPDTEPPYKVSDAEPGMAAPLDTFIRMFKIFIEGKGYDNLKPMKRESKFIEICENLHKDDARIFIDAFLRKFSLPSIGPEEIKEIWGYEIQQPRNRSPIKKKKTDKTEDKEVLDNESETSED